MALGVGAAVLLHLLSATGIVAAGESRRKQKQDAAGQDENLKRYEEALKGAEKAGDPKLVEDIGAQMVAAGVMQDPMGAVAPRGSEFFPQQWYGLHLAGAQAAERRTKADGREVSGVMGLPTGTPTPSGPAATVMAATPSATRREPPLEVGSLLGGMPLPMQARGSAEALPAAPVSPRTAPPPSPQAPPATQAPAAQAFDPVPPMLSSNVAKFKGKVGGVEFEGTHDEAVKTYVARQRAKNIPVYESVSYLGQQGVAVPLETTTAAFNNFVETHVPAGSVVRDPGRILETLAAQFPQAPREAFQHFRERMFADAFGGARERQQKVYGVNTTLANRLALDETIRTFGAGAVPQNLLPILRDMPTIDGMMAEAVQNKLAGVPGADQSIQTLQQAQADAAASIERARINTQQQTRFVPPEQLSKLQGRGGRPLPYGTTEAGAAGRGATPISPEEQAGRLAEETKKAGQRVEAASSLVTISNMFRQMSSLIEKFPNPSVMQKLDVKTFQRSEAGQAVRAYDKFLDGFSTTLSRGLSGEVGVLTDQDRAVIRNMLVSGDEFFALVLDRPTAIKENIRNIAQVMRERISLAQAEGQDTKLIAVTSRMLGAVERYEKTIGAALDARAGKVGKADEDITTILQKAQKAGGAARGAK